MKKSILLLILLIAGMMSVKADNITVDGVNRSYNVYAPKNLPEGRPLLIFCHGYGQDANWMHLLPCWQLHWKPTHTSVVF